MASTWWPTNQGASQHELPRPLQQSDRDCVPAREATKYCQRVRRGSCILDGGSTRSTLRKTNTSERKGRNCGECAWKCNLCYSRLGARRPLAPSKTNEVWDVGFHDMPAHGNDILLEYVPHVTLCKPVTLSRWLELLFEVGSDRKKVVNDRYPAGLKEVVQITAKWRLVASLSGETEFRVFHGALEVSVAESITIASAAASLRRLLRLCKFHMEVCKKRSRLCCSSKV